MKLITLTIVIVLFNSCSTGSSERVGTDSDTSPSYFFHVDADKVSIGSYDSGQLKTYEKDGVGKYKITMYNFKNLDYVLHKSAIAAHMGEPVE